LDPASQKLLVSIVSSVDSPVNVITFYPELPEIAANMYCYKEFLSLASGFIRGR